MPRSIETGCFVFQTERRWSLRREVDKVMESQIAKSIPVVEATEAKVAELALAKKKTPSDL